MSMTRRLGLAWLLLAAPLADAQPPEVPAEAARAAEEAPAPAAEGEAAPDAAAAAASEPPAAEASGESDATAAGGAIEESFSPTERVPADASIRFPVDI